MDRQVVAELPRIPTWRLVSCRMGQGSETCQFILQGPDHVDDFRCRKNSGLPCPGSCAHAKGNYCTGAPHFFDLSML